MEIYATSPDLPSIIDAVQRGSIDDVEHCGARRAESTRPMSQKTRSSLPCADAIQTW
jgi:hypothetical protein